MGGFYTPTNQIENAEDNDGVSHPGSLQYYKQAFNKDGFDTLSEYNFTYATCDYCPGEYWPDNKSGEHTLLIYGTQQPLSDALGKGQIVFIVSTIYSDNQIYKSSNRLRQWSKD